MNLIVLNLGIVSLFSGSFFELRQCYNSFCYMNIFDYINTEKKNFVSLGASCQVKQFLRRNKFLPNEKLPFDFISTKNDFVIKSIESGFEGWLDPNQFFSPFATINRMGTLAPYLCLNKKPGGIFFHEITVDDYDIEDDIKNYTEENVPLINLDSLNRDCGIKLKEGVLESLVIRNKEKIDNFYKIIDSAKTEIDEKPSLIFIRNEKIFSSLESKKISENIFNCLRNLCGEMPFILLYIQDFGNDQEKPFSEEGVVLCNDKQSYCFGFSHHLSEASQDDSFFIYLEKILLTNK